MSEKICTMVYLSTASHPFEEPELLELLQKSRENNSKVGVTGLLLYKNRHFMQAVEGSPDAVENLVSRIQKDPRHFGMVTLIHEVIPERRFPDWSMGFKNLESPEVRELEGFSEFMNSPFTQAEFEGDPSRVQKLLVSFKRKMM